MRASKRHIASLAMLLTSGVLASRADAADQTISTDDPVVTSALTTPLAATDTLTLDDDSDIELDANETGVTLDTDGIFQNDGVIETNDDDDVNDHVTGIAIEGGDISGGVVNTGTISLIDDYSIPDLDDDDDADADTNDDDVDDYEDSDSTNNGSGYATGESRIGIWLKDGTTLHGDILNGIDSDDDDEDESGTISINGDNSYGIFLDGVLDGDLISSGSISVLGDNSYGVRIGADEGGDTDDAAVTGDVSISSVSVYGEGSEGVAVDDTVGGTFTVRGSISATGYHTTSRPSDVKNTDDEDGIDYYEIDAGDKLQSGSAVAINADIAGGIQILGVGLEDDDDDDHDGLDDDDDSNDNLTGSITVYGSAPALSIANSAQIGALDIFNSTNYANEAYNTFGLDASDAFGLFNRGAISAYGLFNDVTATAFSVSGGANIAGGVLNDGTIYAESYNADSFAVLFDGGLTDQIVNRGSITASTISNSTTPSGYTSDDVAADDTAYAIYLNAGSSVAAITNTGILTATGYDSDANSVNEANATVIYDGSNSLTTLNNSGEITASVETLQTTTNVTPIAAGSTIAVDTSGNNVGLTITQTANSINEDDGLDADNDNEDDYDEVVEASITGDILLGSGGDTINLYAGAIDGALSFGDGSDSFNVDNGAIYTGHLTDSDGDLTLNVQNGRLNLTNDASDRDIHITSATFGDGAVLSFNILSATESVQLIADNGSGLVTFQSGSHSQVLLTMPSTLPTSGSVTLITANALDTSGATITTDDNSYLYNFSLSSSSTTLVANYNIKSASDLGLNRNQSAAYSALLDALRLDDDASSAFASLSTKNSFFDAYEDLMPNYSSAVAELATTAIRQGQSASTNRLAASRLRRRNEATVWAQEIGYAVNRTAPTEDGADYDGAGVGFAFGLDGPLDNGDLFGLSVSFITSEASEDGSQADGTIAAWFLQGNAYRGASLGPFEIDLSGGFGAGRLKSRREINIGDDYSATSEAEWMAYEGHGLARVSAPIEVASWLVIAPQSTLTYVALQEDGFTESGGGDAIDYDVESAFSQRLWADVGLKFQPRFEIGGSGMIAPHLFLGYRGHLIDDPAERTMRFASGDTSFTLIDDPVGDGGPLLGLGLDSSNGATTISLSYEGEFSDQIERHSLNAAVRIHF